MVAFLCERIFGKYSEDDVREVTRLLDAGPEEIGLCRSPRESLDYFRCALFIRNKEYELYIPFHCSELILFRRSNDWKDQYRRQNESVPLNPNTTHELLDTALDQLFIWIPSVSMFRLPGRGYTAD